MGDGRRGLELEAGAQAALAGWARENHLTVEIDRFLEGGRTRAQVAVVIVQGRGMSARKLVLKVCPPAGDALREPGRHLAIWDGAPAKFRKEHLVKMWGQALPLADGGFLMFQDFSAPPGTEPMSVLMDRRPEDLAEACEVVVGSVLKDWNTGKSPARMHTLAVSKFLADQLGPGRLEEGSALRRWAGSKGLGPDRAEVTLPGEPSVLPNPLAVALGRLKLGTLRASKGTAHGDLHPGNVLLPVEPAVKPSAFRLIDLSYASTDAPLARDPMLLLLSIVAPRLEYLTEPTSRSELIGFLTAPGSGSAWLSRPLVEVTRTIRDAGASWAAHYRLDEEWDQQVRLSLAACALIFAGRRSVPDDDRLWFFRLAARALQAEIGASDRGIDDPPSAPAGPPSRVPPETDHEPPEPEARPRTRGVHGLDEGRAALLRDTDTTLVSFLERAARLLSTSRLVPAFPEVLADVHVSLQELGGRLNELGTAVRVGRWPHRRFAMAFGGARERALRSLQEATAGISGDRPELLQDSLRAGDLLDAIGALHRLLVDHYPDLEAGTPSRSS
jgi:hypothetical protein